MTRDAWRLRARLISNSTSHPTRKNSEQALTALGRLVLWCMSVAYDDERFEREIRRMRDAIVAAVKAPDGHAALEVLLRYLAATHARLRAGKIGELLMKAAGPEAQEDIVDFVEQLKHEGTCPRRRGRAYAKRMRRRSRNGRCGS